ncbi:hypothetical protein [Tranquillimonas rosea]|uniref:hypothetical protein n=1 Tax=Tranquillimonas rosea TaxID=641238 RepID=UPI003BA8B223
MVIDFQIIINSLLIENDPGVNNIKSEGKVPLVNLPLDKILKLANDRDITLDEPVLNAIQEICEPQDLKEMFDINNSPICTLSPNILMDD